MRAPNTAITKCMFVFVFDNAQRALRSPYSSVREQRRTSEGLIRVKGEFLDIGRLFELKQHATLLGELLPPNHVYSH